MKILKNISLKEYNTFSCDELADTIVEINSYDDWKQLEETISTSPKKEILILGQGSNLLFTKRFQGLLVKPNMKDVAIVEDTPLYSVVRVQSGLLFDELINFCLSNNLYGLENLAGIPGTVGAATVQNIGAYGMEQADCMISLNYLALFSFEYHHIKQIDCAYGYRDSIFKNKLADKSIVAEVFYKLKKKFTPNLNYKDLQVFPENISAVELVRKIRAIRDGKLPDYKKLGNAGSFFKNPIVDIKKYEEITEMQSQEMQSQEMQSQEMQSQEIQSQEMQSQLISYPYSAEKVKLSAGQLIDLCGMKGYTYGNAGVSEQHALVLVNNGNASGKEIKELSDLVIDKVKSKFGITLEPEVRII